MRGEQPLASGQRKSVHGGRWTSLAATTVGFSVGFAAVSLFGPTAKHFQQTLGLSQMQVSWLVAMPSLSGSLLRIPFGASVNTTGGRTPTLLLLSVSILGMISLLVLLGRLDEMRSLPATYSILLCLAVMVGSGIAIFPVGVGQVSYWFPKASQGLALAIYAGLGNITPGLVSIAMPFAYNAVGLLQIYLIWLLVLIAGAAYFLHDGQNAVYFQLLGRGFCREAARELARIDYAQELFPEGSALDGLKTAALHWQTWALVLLYFVSFGGLLGLTAWLPTYWVKAHGVDPTLAGVLTGVFGILSSIVRVFGGSLADAFGGELIATLSFLVLAAGAASMTFTEDLLANVVGEVLMAIGMGAANGAVFKLVPQAAPSAVGGVAGWVGGLGAFGGFVLPPALAALSSMNSLHGYSDSFGILVALAIIGIAVSVLLHRSRRVISFSNGAPLVGRTH